MPRHSGGLFAFQVSNDGVEWSAAGQFRIEGDSWPPVVRKLHPSHGLPGTLLSLYGHGFEDSARLACRFGSRVETAAAFVSANSVQCKVPVLPAATSVAVQASNNGETWSPIAQQPLTFAFDERANFDDVEFADIDSADDNSRQLDDTQLHANAGGGFQLISTSLVDSIDPSYGGQGEFRLTKPWPHTHHSSVLRVLKRQMQAHRFLFQEVLSKSAAKRIVVDSAVL